IEIDLDADVRLARLALDDRRARPVEQHVDHVRPRLLARTVLRDHEAGDADVLRELEILGAAADDRGALTVEDAGREELAHESDARLAAAAALLRPVRADQRPGERDALR